MLSVRSLRSFTSMQMRSSGTLPVVLFVAAVATAFSLSSCGSNKKDPNPVAASTPTPVPGTLAPAPSPSPTTLPGTLRGTSCAKLSPANGGDRDCRPESGRIYEGAVATAMSSVGSQYVNGSEILNFSGFRDDIVRSLDAQGICGVFESDNLFVRGVGDSFNEYYDVVSSDGFAGRRYTNTCRPPVATPVAVQPPVLDPGCKLPPSTNTICTRNATPTFGGDMHDAIQAVIADDRARAKQIIFDFSQALGGATDAYKIIDADAYHKAVMDKLRAKGFCTYYDTEEIQMKNSNLFSEHWDIYKAEGFSIQLYAGVCRDAAF
jgi:hypothetical protein